MIRGKVNTPASAGNITRSGRPRPFIASRGLPGLRLYVVRQTGLVPDCVQPSLVRTGRGLLMVFGEVTWWCLRHAWSLAQTSVYSDGSWLDGSGQFGGGAGDGGIPAHLAG